MHSFLLYSVFPEKSNYKTNKTGKEGERKKTKHNNLEADVFDSIV